MTKVTIFVGLDYHQDSVQVCVMDRSGTVLANRNCDNDWRAIRGSDLALRGGATVARTPRAFWAGVAAGILLAVAAQLFVHRGPGQLEQVADAIAQPIGIVDQPAVEFEFEVDAGSARAKIGLTDLPAEAHVEFQHGYDPFVF